MAVAGIIVKNIYKTYGVKESSFTAINGVNFVLKPGEFVSLLGESGSGKSTLARILAGLEKPDQGQIFFNGEETTAWNEPAWRIRRKQLQAVFQDASGTLNPARSVYHNIEEALVNLTDCDKKQRRWRIETLMKMVKMDVGLLNRKTRQLSGGEQRRLSLLRALAIRPDYLILDEVTSGLDRISADTVMEVLRAYQKESDCACLFVTHDADLAEQMSTRILKMEYGKITREGIKMPEKEENDEEKQLA